MPSAAGARPTPAPPRTLLDVFAATLARCADRVALDAPDARLTYRELDRQAAALSDRLRSLGIGAGDRVGIRVPSGTAELYVAILGTLRAGAAYVPVDADDPAERAEMIWDRAGVSAVLAQQLELRQRLAPGGSPRAVTVDDDAWIIFTSGSTGEPKGVAVTHRSAAAFVDAETALWTVEPDSRVLAGLSVAFDASCEEIWLAWRNGAALVPAPRDRIRAGAELGPWIAEQRITVISTVPTLAALWARSDIASVRLLILGGEACPEPLVRRLAPGRALWNTYGPTEATVVSTATRLHPGSPVTIGWPLGGWQVAVVDQHQEPVALGEAGELVIAGVGLGRYLDPELDATRFAPVPALGWERAYRTGDIVRETADGIEFIGRRDDQVKIGGRRIELGEVESQLAALPGIRAAAVVVQRTETGNPLLVGYVVGDTDASGARALLAQRLPQDSLPVIVRLDALPTTTAGKLDRRALPWPPPQPEQPELTGALGWLAERWREQLGPLPIAPDSDFFALGGSSLAAAKLASVLRRRYPSIAVADIYNHRRLEELAARLEALDVSTTTTVGPRPVTGRRRWSAVQLAGVAVLVALSAPQWLLAILAINQLEGHIGPDVGWAWLIAGWIVFGSAAGRATIVVIARRILIPRVKPGRYPRRGWLMCRLWFLERLGEAYRAESLAGTPFAARFARLCGHRVGAGARLGALPRVTSSVSIGDGATIEADVDLHGWWIEGDELVLGEIEIGPRARVGSRALLAPGAEIGAGAEIEPGTVVNGPVPAGERWAGSPGKCVGAAGESWPADPAPRPHRPRFWRAMYGVGLGVQALLPLAAGAPALLYLILTGSDQTYRQFVSRLLVEAPIIAGSFVVTYAVLVALLVRAVGKLQRPGYHADEGMVGWALWFGEALMLGARGVLFSLYSSIFTRAWLRLAGIRVGRGAEVSTVVGANRLTSFGERSFTADDVALISARSRNGWLHVAPVEIGAGTFLGNGAIVAGDSKLGDRCLIGVLTTAPKVTPDGTSWLGAPALELPRVADAPPASRTTDPPAHLIAARAAMDLTRILLPATISVLLAGLIFWTLHLIGQSSATLLPMALATPAVLLVAGICAVAITVAAKWLVMGRYQPGNHPLWSLFVWRDEIMNSLQDQLAGTWLLGFALASPVMPWYLRAMGSKVGREVWCDTLTITEFDMVELGDGCVVNRFACVETHLFHDRLMRIGPARLRAGSTLGPASCLLPDTVLGAGAKVAGRSVVLRGEELPPGTSWHGAPVVAV